MSKQTSFSVAVCFVFLYSLSYFATELLKVPLFWYYPTEHRWVFAESPPAGLMMGWYGKVLFSLMFAGLGAGLLALGLKLSRRELPAGLQGFLDLATMCMVLFTLYYLANSLAHRIL